MAYRVDETHRLSDIINTYVPYTHYKVIVSVIGILYTT